MVFNIIFSIAVSVFTLYTTNISGPSKVQTTHYIVICFNVHFVVLD